MTDCANGEGTAGFPGGAILMIPGAPGVARFARPPPVLGMDGPRRGFVGYAL